MVVPVIYLRYRFDHQATPVATARRRVRHKDGRAPTRGAPVFMENGNRTRLCRRRHRIPIASLVRAPLVVSDCSIRCSLQIQRVRRGTGDTRKQRFQ